jgi:hypothetical protein
MKTATMRSSVLEEARAPARSRAAVVAAIGLIGLAIFQLALALGAPLGRAAWGGSHTYLPVGLRVASGVAVLFWVLMALMVLRRGGYRVRPFSLPVSRVGTWVLVGVLSLGALANLASRSPWERFGWGPVALILAVLCLVVARGEWTDARR